MKFFDCIIKKLHFLSSDKQSKIKLQEKCIQLSQIGGTKDNQISTFLATGHNDIPHCLCGSSNCRKSIKGFLGATFTEQCRMLGMVDMKIRENWLKAHPEVAYKVVPKSTRKILVKSSGMQWIIDLQTEVACTEVNERHGVVDEFVVPNDVSLLVVSQEVFPDGPIQKFVKNSHIFDLNR